MKKIITSLRVFAVFAVILGLIYPIGITVVSQLLMPQKANGSLITLNEKIIGSKLIGQAFTSPKYFHSRYSAADYDATNSGGNNYGPSNQKLIAQTTDRIKNLRAENDIPSSDTSLPADMVLTSASGLDPHISMENALLQLPRVAKARNLAPEKIKPLITASTDPDFVGIWGKAGINVLKLNLALDKL